MAAAPPARYRSAHFLAVVGEHWNRSPARRSGQPSSTTQRASRNRPLGVNKALAWDMRTSRQSNVRVVTTPIPEVLIYIPLATPFTTCLGVTPRASAADSSASTPSSAPPRTLLAHITSPLIPDGTRPAPLPPSDLPLPLSRPAALTASGTRGLPASAAPSVFRLAVRVVSGQRVGRSAVVPVERAVDPAMTGHRVPAPREPSARITD